MFLLLKRIKWFFFQQSKLETEDSDELTWIGGLTRIARHIAERDVSQTATTSLVYKCTSPGCEVSI
jgi:hypothetical protein